MMPVYDFLSFQINSFSFNRESSGQPEFFQLQITNDSFDKLKNTYQMNIKFEIQFSNNPISVLNAEANFRINNLDWMSSIEKNLLNATLFASVFPFIRNYVIQLTNDSRGIVTIPIIDLRFNDLQKGIKFTAVRN